MDDFFRLAKPRIPTLRGLKHTSPSFPSMNTLLMRHSDSQVFLGSDEVYLEALSIGIDVTICNSYLGHVLNRLKNAFDRGDIATARLEQVGHIILVIQSLQCPSRMTTSLSE